MQNCPRPHLSIFELEQWYWNCKGIRQNSDFEDATMQTYKFEAGIKSI
jgi:hypothetical protein